MKKKTILFIALLTGVIIGGLLVLLFPVGNWWTGWLSGAFLIVLAAATALFLPNWLDTGKKGLWLTIAAFIIRFVIGVALMLMLPAWGYDNDQQNAGYVFKDAYSRDTASYELAASGDSLLNVFNAEFFTDQYGGLAFISTLVYRVFSMDAHRPYLMLIVSSWAFSSGTAFFYAALSKRFSAKLARAASWIVVLYPEGIFFTASQMREPFMIGGAMILIWGMLTWFEKEERKKVLFVCVPVLIILGAISWLMLGAALLVLTGWFGIEWIQRNVADEKRRKAYILLFGGIFVILGGMAIIGRSWLLETIGWDMNLMLHSSGHLEVLVEDQPALVQYVFMTVYGVLQMLPPAALIESSVVIWKVISLLRSLGWYIFLPLLGYGIYAVWKKEHREQRSLVAWLLAFTWFWTIFASLRGGGDSWDNPRYRMMALPIMAILIVWLWSRRDHWLWRIVSVEVFGLLIFTHWYISRYWHWWSPLPIVVMIAVVGIVGFLVLASGAWVEIKRKRASE